MHRILHAIAVVSFLLGTSSYARIFPSVVPNLELNRYIGKWYEVASTKPFFQRGCVCVTATYNLKPDGDVQVLNSCRKDRVDADEEIIEGSASPTSNPAKFRVSFFGVWAPFSNYWIVDLADDYSYAVVSTPFKRPIWILSRTPSLSQETLDGILTRLKDARFPTASISSTLQEGCPIQP